MIVGFTGTQNGMTTQQCRAVYTLLRDLKPEYIHHGDCIGADHEVDLLVREVPFHVVLHPPSSGTKRVWCAGKHIKKVHEVKPYLERNKDIVNDTDVLIAAPKTMREQIRSGTWATVRYARSINRKIYIVWPNGVVDIENQ